MEGKKKVRKIAPPPSSSSSSSDSSSSSSSEETRRKQKHRNIRKQQQESSSSSEEETVRKPHKHASHKKSSTVRKHSHSAKVRAKLVQSSAKKTARSMSPASRAAHKHHQKAKLAKKAKLAQLEEHDRRSRTPTRRDVKKERTPEHRIASPTTRIRVSVPNNRVTVSRGVKESPSTSRRHVREPAGEKERAEILARCQERQRERDRIRRVQEEDERYKHNRVRVPEKHHHERSRSHSRGKIPIRERLDKDYEYRRSISREHEEYPLMRPTGRERERPEPERNFDYRGDERRIASQEYGQSSRVYDERVHRGGWEGEREEPRGSRIYEGRNWEASKRIPDEPYKEPHDRSWNEDKWAKEKEPKEWNRGSSWKDHVLPSSSSAPTMHPRRWPGPSDSWTPRKMDHSPASTPSFKPRFSGSSPHFGFKRFPFKRFPNQYSKINYPSKRVIPSASSAASTPTRAVTNPPEEISQEPQPGKVEPSESGEINTEPEEDKVEADTTTVGSNVETQSQEECEEGNLSEFSDVDDEILNREEVS